MVEEEREKRRGGGEETYGFAAQYSLMGGWPPIVTAQIHMGMGGIVWG